MAILLTTTTITVRGVRPQSPVDPDAEGYDGDPAVPTPTVLATGVRACVSNPVASRDVDQRDGIVEYTLRCDLFDAGLSRYDTVTDDKTGEAYSVHVVAVSPTELFGLQHIKATLRKGEGVRDDATNS